MSAPQEHTMNTRLCSTKYNGGSYDAKLHHVGVLSPLSDSESVLFRNRLGSSQMVYVVRSSFTEGFDQEKDERECYEALPLSTLCLWPTSPCYAGR